MPDVESIKSKMQDAQKKRVRLKFWERCLENNPKSVIAARNASRIRKELAEFDAMMREVRSSRTGSINRRSHGVHLIRCRFL